jgi:hypothetical protein
MSSYLGHASRLGVWLHCLYVVWLDVVIRFICNIPHQMSHNILRFLSAHPAPNSYSTQPRRETYAL